MKNWPYQHALVVILVGVLLVSIGTHFLFYSRQQSSVFDEVYFGAQAQSYYTHNYYFDIHPPLGKLLLAASALPEGISKTASFQTTSTKGTQPDFGRLRLLPTIAGVALPLIMVLLARRFGMRLRTAAAVGILTAFENGLVAHGRFITLDIFMLVFGFSGLLCFMQYRQHKNNIFLLLSGFLAGAAFSIKWIGVFFWILVVSLLLYELIKDRTFSVKKLMTILLGFVIMPAALYVGSFAVHFALLNRAGPGDVFMSASFNHSLEGSAEQQSRTLRSPAFLHKFIELNKAMLYVDTHLQASHPYSSKWYSWPLMERGILYYAENNQTIYLLGNPVVWWSGSFAVFLLTCCFIQYGRNRTYANIVLLLAFLTSWLPFMFVHRVMFLYHYFIALLFSILILGKLLDQGKYSRVIVPTILSCAVLSFIYFAPITYGLPLSPSALQARMWLPTWR